MSDVSEVNYGIRLLYEACAPERYRDRLRGALDNISDSLRPEFERYWEGWRHHLVNDTYVTCLSEHRDSEDQFGRLSMWRAYGQECGVALVLNSDAFRRPTPNFGAVTSPVAYLGREDFMSTFGELVTSIENNVDYLKTQLPNELAGRLFSVFRFAAVGTKHPAFQEEFEWRVVYSPKLDQSKYIEREVVVIGGVPQPIHKIPLRNIPEAGLADAEIPALLNRIIIGPTDFGPAIADAFVDLLRAAGVGEPETRVFLSNIPLRSR